MRFRALAVFIGLVLTACGDDDGLPPDKLDHDAAPRFAGLWYGAAELALGQLSQQTQAAEFLVSATGRNALAFPGFCSDDRDDAADRGPAARVTSDSGFVIARHSCVIGLGGCAMSWEVRRGSGTLVDGTLTATFEGVATGCGVSTEMSITFTGTSSPSSLPPPVDPGAQPPLDRGPPVALATNALATVRTGRPVTLDGSASHDPDSRPLTYAWSIAQQPAGAAATLEGATLPGPTFTASVEGRYTVRLTVTAADGQSATTTVAIDVFAAQDISPLAHRVVHAEFSRSLGRIVMTDGNPNALYIHDPVSGSESKVELPLAPQCLSVSPDGKHALVGHNAWVSYVDLVAAKLEKSIQVTVDVRACVLASEWAYVFPASDWDAVHSIALATGVETGNTTNHYAGSRGVLTPDGATLYAVTANQSPMDLKRWNVSGGVATLAYEMAYHGDYAVGGLIWMERSGARVLTSAGTAFRTSSVREQDMTYAGALEGLSAVTHLDSSATEIAVIPAKGWWGESDAPDDTGVELFNTTYLGNVGRIVLPRWGVGNGAYATHGRFVFYSADGAKKHVVVQADATSGLLLDTAVLTY